MELIRGIHNLQPKHRGCVVTIGNFDGVHLGHQQLLKQLKQVSEELQLPSTVVTFEPLPHEYFQGKEHAARLTHLRDKCLVFKQLKIDRLVCVNFNQLFASQSAEDFITEFLVGKLNAQYLIVGKDFRFGHQRQGDFALLQKYCEQHNIHLEQTEDHCLNDNRISSTRIRAALAEGDFDTAKAYLGRNYSIAGRIAHGDKRGRQLGFPTANISLHRNHIPLSGVYVIQLNGIASTPIHGVANIGTRPTVDGTKKVLEVHLFDFDQEIYGAHVQVEFLKKVRDEKRFDSLEALKAQIADDVVVAKGYFNR